VAAGQVEERRQPPVRQLAPQPLRQLRHRHGAGAAVVVLEDQRAGAAVAAEVDPGRPDPRDRGHQVVEGAQLGRRLRTVHGQGQGQAVALGLVVQAGAAGRCRDVDHQPERPDRRTQQGGLGHFAGGRAHQVEPAVADEEGVTVVQQFPRQRQQFVSGPQQKQGPVAGGQRLPQPLAARLVEQQVEQGAAERRGGASEVGPVGVAGRRRADQAAEGAEVGDEAGVGRRRGDGAGAAVGTDDEQAVAVAAQVEGEHLPQGQPPQVVFGQFPQSPRAPGDQGGDLGHGPAGGGDRLGGGQGRVAGGRLRAGRG